MTAPTKIPPNGATLTAHTFYCGRCHKPSKGAGRGYRLILGTRVQVCAACRVVMDQQRARAAS